MGEEKEEGKKYVEKMWHSAFLQRGKCFLSYGEANELFSTYGKTKFHPLQTGPKKMGKPLFQENIFLPTKYS